MTKKSKKKPSSASIKKNLQKTPSQNTQPPSTQDPWLSNDLEHALLSSDAKEVKFYKKDGKIKLILPITVLISEGVAGINAPLSGGNDTKTVNQRFDLDDPNLGFYLIHFDVSPHNIEKVIQAHTHFFPKDPRLVDQTVQLDSSLTIEHQTDPTGVIGKKLFTAQLYFLGHSIVNYAVMRNNRMSLTTLLRNHANPNQHRVCSEAQQTFFLKIKKRTIIDQLNFVNSLELNLFQSHIKILKSDTFILNPPDLSVSFRHLGKVSTFKKCKIFYNIHEETCTFSGFRQNDDGELEPHPENIKNIDQNQIKTIVCNLITLDQPKAIMIFLRLGTLGLHWFDQMSPLNIATNNGNSEMIFKLMQYNADPFFRPLNQTLTPIAMAIENNRLDLLPNFYKQYHFFDVRKEHNFINHLIENNYFRVAFVTLTSYSYFIDAHYLVEKHPREVAIMLSQKTASDDQQWQNYIATSQESHEVQVKAIMDAASPEALSQSMLSFAGLIIAFWKKHPPTDDQLYTFIDWCIENKHTMPIELIVVKLKKKLTLNANISCHDQLRHQYPQDITFVQDDAAVVYSHAEVVDAETKEDVVNKKKTLVEISDIKNEIDKAMDLIPGEKPFKMSYKHWFTIRHLEAHIDKLSHTFETYQTDVTQYFEKIIKAIVSAENGVSEIKSLLSLTPISTEEDTPTLFHGKLEEDLTRSHQPMMNLFDEINESDLFALKTAKLIEAFREELKTTLICDRGFFIKQFFILLKEALHTTESMEKTTQTSLSEIIDTVISATTHLFYSNDWYNTSARKDELCHDICEWIFKEKKNTAKIHVWVQDFYSRFKESTGIMPSIVDNVLSDHSYVYMCLINLGGSNLGHSAHFIHTTAQLIKTLIQKRDALCINQAGISEMDDEALDNFRHQNLIDLKSIVITINKIASNIPMFINDETFVKVTGEDYESIKFALYGLQLTNQPEMNHSLLTIDSCDLWHKPQFIISIFEALDSLSTIIDRLINHHSPATPSPK
ncbi:MAG: hypothetical protein P8L77_01845 [Gammaproteobacteria bacterium]|nr:hypothetical protein [Gammaproteobacteria bacterium]